MKLASHSHILCGKSCVLRPLTENDWDILLRWNSDPEILYYTEGDDAESYSLDEIQQIYRSVSQSAFCFIIEHDSVAIGECWLQVMNLDYILQKYPAQKCQRIDLMIGEKSMWGRGIGHEVIKLLTDFAFAEQDADLVFGCGIADYNQGSQRVFEKNGYRVDAKLRQPAGNKAAYRYDLVQGRARWAETTTHADTNELI